MRGQRALGSLGHCQGEEPRDALSEFTPPRLESLSQPFRGGRSGGVEKVPWQTWCNSPATKEGGAARRWFQGAAAINTPAHNLQTSMSRRPFDGARNVHWVWFGVPCSTEMSSHGRVDRGSSSLESWGARFHGPRPECAMPWTLGVGVLLLSILPDRVLCYSSVTASLSDGLGGNALYASHRTLSQAS